MPINASPHFDRAKAEYEQAQTTEQKINCLKKMITLAPKHKGAENLLAQLKTRLKKLKYSKEKEDKSGKSTKAGIKKAEMQISLIGLTNSGKSCLINKLTNTNSPEADYEFTTTETIIGTMIYEKVRMQILDLPAINSDDFDQGLANSSDVLLIIITKISEIDEIKKLIPRAKGKQLIVFNKIDKLNKEESRKTEATLKSKKYNYCLVSCKEETNLEELKEKIWKSFDKIRIYTKEPKKPKTKDPIILNQGSIVKDAAEKILHGFSSKIKSTTLTGPSSKFPNQKVGLKHILKDNDVVEFHVG